MRTQMLFWTLLLACLLSFSIACGGGGDDDDSGGEPDDDDMNDHMDDDTGETEYGACCNDETCAVTTYDDCSGSWQGPETNCDPNPCGDDDLDDDVDDDADDDADDDTDDDADDDVDDDADDDADDDLPEAPSGLSTEVLSVYEVQLSWRDNSDDEDGFRVFRSLEGFREYVQIAVTGPGIEGYLDETVEPNNDYLYTIASFNLDGDSERTEEAAASTQVDWESLDCGTPYPTYWGDNYLSPETYISQLGDSHFLQKNDSYIFSALHEYDYGVMTIITPPYDGIDVSHASFWIGPHAGEVYALHVEDTELKTIKLSKYSGSAWNEIFSQDGSCSYSYYDFLPYENSLFLLAPADPEVSCFSDRTLQHYDGSSWSDWATISSLYDQLSFAMSPTMVCLRDMRESDLQCYENGVLHSYPYSGNFTPLNQVGTPTSGKPLYGYDSYFLKLVKFESGSGFTQQNINTYATFNDVWGPTLNSVFAVGDYGTIAHYDGSIWTIMPTPTTENLASVDGNSSTDVYAVGSSGTILHYDGQSWSRMLIDNVSYFPKVKANGPGNVYIIGNTVYKLIP